MSSHSSSPDIDQRLFDTFSAVIDGWKDNKSVNWAGYAQNYATLEKTRYIRTSFEDSVIKNVKNFTGSIGCDIGCWLGFTCEVAVTMGATHVYGIEILDDFATFNDAWRGKIDSRERLTFAAIKSGAVPLQTETVDWVYINQVLCNAMPNSFSSSLREAHRILKPGGTLVLCDSNNPYCSQTVERLLRVYRQHELGTGTLDKPDGSNFRARCNIVRAAAPTLDDEQVSTLAKNTCYLSGEAIRAAARNLAYNSVMATSCFRDDLSLAVCNPTNGGALGNLTNPFTLAAELESLGFRTVINTSPNRQASTNTELLQKLSASQGFYVFADKVS